MPPACGGMVRPAPNSENSLVFPHNLARFQENASPALRGAGKNPAKSGRSGSSGSSGQSGQIRQIRKFLQFRPIRPSRGKSMSLFELDIGLACRQSLVARPCESVFFSRTCDKRRATGGSTCDRRLPFWTIPSISRQKNSESVEKYLIE